MSYWRQLHQHVAEIGDAKAATMTARTIAEEKCIAFNLSIRQHSLVLLARALVNDTRVLILDKAMASVDYGTDSKIQRTITNEFKERVLYIAHKFEKTPRCKGSYLVYTRILQQPYAGPKSWKVSNNIIQLIIRVRFDDIPCTPHQVPPMHGCDGTKARCGLLWGSNTESNSGEVKATTSFSSTRGRESENESKNEWESKNENGWESENENENKNEWESENENENEWENEKQIGEQERE
ncbi:hypothetical protein DFJ58DRAFT_848273 [Suillus subalutaceus]|uniref:uncharacterized protein n=1 Tax=Suillus subalutaceus TaxID=48586 RepID=UPI001B86A2E7|nr:uncharacterized protein DFJ58DRAFT_848273 [Suillus subalutaceus]KAG1831203.1 hypothetical protein DFJ58DRAFT_848273 [Suillus subalutaceus]